MPAMHTMTVRLATPADIDALVALMSAAHAEGGYALDRDHAAAAFAALLADPALGGAWIARSADGAPIGHVVLTLRFSIDDGARCGHIEDLYVRPEQRRSGAGRALVAALVDACRARGCGSMQVETGGDNAAALALYARFGLTPHGDGRVLLAGAVG